MNIILFDFYYTKKNDNNNNYWTVNGLINDYYQMNIDYNCWVIGRGQSAAFIGRHILSRSKLDILEEKQIIG